MTELTGRDVGFASPATDRKASIRRTGIELAATAGLAVALMIAAAAVSIGMARARVLDNAARYGGTPLAVAMAGLSVVAAGWGGLSALVVRETALPPGV